MQTWCVFIERKVDVVGLITNSILVPVGRAGYIARCSW